jgi:hypothetical protein
LYIRDGATGRRVRASPFPDLDDMPIVEPLTATIGCVMAEPP